MWRVLPRRAWIALVLIGLAVIACVFAIVDAKAMRGKPLRHTVIGRRDVGGLSVSDLNTAIDDLENAYRRTPIRIALPGGGFTITGADAGLSIDTSAVRRDALRSGRETNTLLNYAKAWFGRRNVPVAIRIDRAKLADSLRMKEGEERLEPLDPQLRVRNGRFTVTPGRTGRGLSVDLLADEIPRSVAQTDPSDGVGVTISTEPVPLPSRYTEAEVQQLLKDAELMTATPISVVSGDRSATITPELLRAWVRPAIVGREVLLRLDEKATVDGLVKLLGRVGRPPRNAKLTVNPDGTVSAEPSETGQRCCTPQSVAALQASLSAPVRAVVQVDLIEEQPAITTEQVVALGVKEPISTFTTKHRAGEDRVQNIHHIADLLRGTVIAPGETFSVNKAIGPRSAANGFIKAHVIEDGVFAENFGGGISQFATTMFNASFFAGLDLVEYQSHSLYISRYPFGREATLSFPRPDLKVRNNTPYGILIWPTYTNSSVTVTLYSTRFATAEAGKPDVKLRDQCKVVTTSRTITFADGTTKKDTVKAIYRPKEGIDCKGNPTAGATTTTVAAPTRTTRKSDSVDTQPGTSKPKTIEAVEPSGDTTTKPSPDTADTKVKVPVSKAPTTKPPAVPRPDPVTPARPPASVVEPAAPPVNVVT